METELFNAFLKDGAFASLFVFLLIYVLKNNKEREIKYQEVIEINQKVISEQAAAFASLSKDVNEIKQVITQTVAKGRD